MTEGELDTVAWPDPVPNDRGNYRVRYGGKGTPKYEAMERVKRIRRLSESLAEWVAEVKAAFAARDWEPLGYPSWNDYVLGEYGREGCLPRVPKDTLPAIVQSMAESMSLRAIEATLGIGKSTVHRVLAGLEAPPGEAVVPPGTAASEDDQVSEPGTYTVHVTDVTPDPEPEKTVHVTHVTPDPPPKCTGKDGKSYSPKGHPGTAGQQPERWLQTWRKITGLARLVPAFKPPGHSPRSLITQDMADLVVHLLRKLGSLAVDTDPARRKRYVATLDEAYELLDKIRVDAGDQQAEGGEP